MLATTAALSESAHGLDRVLGYEWGRPSSVWQRSNFTRTSEPYQNDRGERCHMAVGLGCRYDEGTYRWLCEEARELMVGGSLVFEGTVSKPATVTVAGQPATVTAANAFRGTARRERLFSAVISTTRTSAGPDQSRSPGTPGTRTSERTRVVVPREPRSAPAR